MSTWHPEGRPGSPRSHQGDGVKEMARKTGVGPTSRKQGHWGPQHSPTQRRVPAQSQGPFLSRPQCRVTGDKCLSQGIACPNLTRTLLGSPSFHQGAFWEHRGVSFLHCQTKKDPRGPKAGPLPVPSRHGSDGLAFGERPAPRSLGHRSLLSPRRNPRGEKSASPQLG